jgi:uncharacterized membrane protein
MKVTRPPLWYAVATIALGTLLLLLILVGYHRDIAVLSLRLLAYAAAGGLLLFGSRRGSRDARHPAEHADRKAVRRYSAAQLVGVMIAAATIWYLIGHAG